MNGLDTEYMKLTFHTEYTIHTEYRIQDTIQRSCVARASCITRACGFHAKVNKQVGRSTLNFNFKTAPSTFAGNKLPGFSGC